MCDAAPFCCDEEWDAICAQFAPAICGGDPQELCLPYYREIATFAMENPDGRTHKSRVVVASTDGRHFQAFIEKDSFEKQRPGTYFVDVQRKPEVEQDVELVVEASWDAVPPPPDAAPAADAGVPPVQDGGSGTPDAGSSEPTSDAGPGPGTPDAAVPAADAGSSEPTADAAPVIPL
jgi:hypothetical protein